MTLDFGPKVESDVKRIRDNDDLTERDKELLLDFKRDLKLDGVSSNYLHKLLVNLNLMGEQLRTGFEEAGEDDLKEVVEWVQDKDISPVTKSHYKRALKRFYKWKNGGEYPKKVGWITTTLKRRNSKLPEKLLTEDDVRKLTEAAQNARDRALVALLWETGARISEVLGLQVDSFEERENGKKIVINGKTGPRRLPLIESIPHVNRWLSEHPRRDDPEAPLWCRINDGGKGKKLGHRYILKSLNEIASRAGIDKPVNPHHFRHSRATYLANRMTEAQMCEWFGWVQGSDRPATYVHLSGRDIDLAYDRMHGYQEEEEDGKPELSPSECPRCDSMNDPGAKFCQKCGLALDEEAAMKVDEKRKLGEIVQEKAEDIEVQGSLDDLLLEAAKRGLKDILKDEDLERLAKESRS